MQQEKRMRKLLETAETKTQSQPTVRQKKRLRIRKMLPLKVSQKMPTGQKMLRMKMPVQMQTLTQ